VATSIAIHHNYDKRSRSVSFPELPVSAFTTNSPVLVSISKKNRSDHLQHLGYTSA